MIEHLATRGIFWLVAKRGFFRVALYIYFTSFTMPRYTV